MNHLSIQEIDRLNRKYAGRGVGVSLYTKYEDTQFYRIKVWFPNEHERDRFIARHDAEICSVSSFLG